MLSAVSQMSRRCWIVSSSVSVLVCLLDGCPPRCLHIASPYMCVCNITSSSFEDTTHTVTLCCDYFIFSAIFSYFFRRLSFKIMCVPMWVHTCEFIAWRSQKSALNPQSWGYKWFEVLNVVGGNKTWVLYKSINHSSLHHDLSSLI